MDGHFVPSRSVGNGFLSRFRLPLGSEVHLMVQHPEEWMSLVDTLRVASVIIPCEVRPTVDLIAAYRRLQIRTVISINPSTSVSALSQYLKEVQRVHIMTVRPGKYGALFRPAMIRRISTLHRRYPRLTISCDGGLTDQTLPEVRKAGANIFVVGSALIENPVPRKKLQELEALL